ncbi:MAG: glycoside-pentoside-hexuronide (GPH):cation symporter [Bacillota bacterium]
MTNTVSNDKISGKTKWSFAVGGFGKDMMYAMSPLMFIFFTEYVMISAGIVGIMIMIARVWDAVNDPIMGTIVDNTRSRFGKFRPWIFTGSVINTVVLLFVYFKPELDPNSAAMVAYISIFYVLWGMSYTLMDIPFWSLIPTLSQDQKEREGITVIARVFTNIGGFIITGGWPVIVVLLGGGAGRPEQVKGFFTLAVIVSVVFLLTQMLVCKNVKERHTALDQPKITLKKMLGLLKQNDQLLVVMVAVVIFNFAIYITSTMAVYFFKYDLNRAGTMDTEAIQLLLTAFLGIGGIFLICAMLAYPLFTKFFKRRQIFNLTIFLSIAGYLGFLATSFFFNNSLYILFPVGIVVFIGFGLAMVLQTVLLTDTVEYGQWKLGHRSESITFSVQTFVVKLATGLASGVVGVGLTAVGFKADMVQALSTVFGMRVLMFVIPIIALLIALYIFNKYHILDENKYNAIVREIKTGKGVNALPQ